MTVAGTTVPSVSKTWVMPIFLPMIPVTAIVFTRAPCQLFFVARGAPPPLAPRGSRRSAAQRPRYARGFADFLLMFLAERLDLHVHARRQIELHQRVHRLRRRLEDVDQPLVGADLELLARLLVHVRRSEHGPLVLFRRQRNRPRQPRACPLGRLDNLAGALVEHARVVGLQANANLVSE